MKHVFSILFILNIATIQADKPKVLVITHSYNRPDFIELQYKTFKKFLKDDYEYVVFNDGPTDKQAHEITTMCDRLGIRCFRMPQELHKRPYLNRQECEPEDSWNTPSVRCCNVFQYSLDHLGFNHDGIVAVLDSDMFLIRDFSIVDYLKGYDIAGIAQWWSDKGQVFSANNPSDLKTYAIKNLWIGIIYADMRTLPNKWSLDFNIGFIDYNPKTGQKGIGTDAGGFSAYYLRNNPTAKVLYFQNQLDIVSDTYTVDYHDPIKRKYISKEEALEKIKFDSHLINLILKYPDDIQLIGDYSFLHYRRGTNYHHMPESYHRHKTGIINSFFNDILK